jgi:hypothetical protein
MKRVFSLLSLSAALAFHLTAAIDGTVVNKTSGQAQAGVSITLVKPGQNGMQTIGTTVSDAQGHFRFEKDQPGGGPQLLQASYKGVNYNKLMTPNIPTSGVELDIYEATTSPAVAQIAEQMLVLEPSENHIGADLTVVIQNQSNTTYTNPSVGDFRFYLPPAAKGQVQVRAQGPQGMPLPRTAEKTNEPNVYKVEFPLKPGETQIEVSYTLPASAPMRFDGKVTGVKGMPAGPLRLIAPPGVTFAGKDLQNLGTEPKTGATIYNVISPGEFSAAITGTGSLHPQNDAPQVDTSDEPPITEGPPLIYRHLSWLLALAFAVLAAGLASLYFSSPGRSAASK